jgi:hypothetical protein
VNIKICQVFISMLKENIDEIRNALRKKGKMAQNEKTE